MCTTHISEKEVENTSMKKRQQRYAERVPMEKELTVQGTQLLEDQFKKNVTVNCQALEEIRILLIAC